MTVSVLILLPSLVVFFTLYWRQCIRVAYEFFALSEYIAIVIVYVNYIVSILDVRSFECKIIRYKK